jgi:hypothetical protein
MTNNGRVMGVGVLPRKGKRCEAERTSIWKVGGSENPGLCPSPHPQFRNLDWVLITARHSHLINLTHRETNG